MVPGRTFLIGGGFLLFRGGRALQRGSLGKLDKPNLFIYGFNYGTTLFLAAEDITEIPGILRPGISLTLLSPL